MVVLRLEAAAEHAGDPRRQRRGLAVVRPAAGFKLRQLLGRYNGMPRAHFHLLLAECEWRLRCGAPRRCLHLLRHWVSRI